MASQVDARHQGESNDTPNASVRSRQVVSVTRRTFSRSFPLVPSFSLAAHLSRASWLARLTRRLDTIRTTPILAAFPLFPDGRPQFSVWYASLALPSPSRCCISLRSRVPRPQSIQAAARCQDESIDAQYVCLCPCPGPEMGNILYTDPHIPCLCLCRRGSVSPGHRTISTSRGAVPLMSPSEWHAKRCGGY